MFKVKKIIKSLFRIPLIIFLTILLTQDFQLFPGYLIGKFTRFPEKLPDNIKSEVIDLSDGNSLEIWSLPGMLNKSMSGKSLLFFHGNAEFLFDSYELMEWMSRLGFDVYAYSYRGFANSTGFPSAKKLLSDSREVWSYLNKKYALNSQNSVFVGRSLGTGIASYLAAYVQPAGLLLLAPYTKITDIVASRFLLKYFEHFIWNDFNQDLYVSNISSPCVLMVHGVKDDLIPVKFAEKLVPNFNKTKPVLKIYEDAGHINVVTYAKTDIERFFQECLIGPAKVY